MMKPFKSTGNKLIKNSYEEFCCICSSISEGFNIFPTDFCVNIGYFYNGELFEKLDIFKHKISFFHIFRI
jgi:hypothetical protein